MIPSNNYYDPMENPSDKVKRQMWRTIQQEIGHTERKGVFIVDWRSFAYGAVASLTIMFACAGAYSILSKLIDSAKPQTLRLDSAYESAIQQFERFVPAISTSTPEEKTMILTRKEQLRYLDGAIEEIKKDINGNDLSPLKRARLRQLYGTKLGVLQEMIERGEIEL